MLELVLLLGLAAMFASLRRTQQRLRDVEEQLGVLASTRFAEPEASAQPTPQPAHGHVNRAEPNLPVLDAPEEAAAPAPELAPAPEPAPAREPAPAKETLAALFERFVGGRLLIWIGGIALAVSGVFLVRYSIEIGLVTPPVRMLMAGLFGLILVGAGEVARSRAGAIPDPRIAQALVGAGILVLYATPYGSHVLYGLVGLGTATVLMGLVTIAALVLSLRHGAATAVLGLAGGFLTPLLVGGGDIGAVPLLSYLALLNLALFALAQRRGWTWLAAGAVLLSFGWTAVLSLSVAADALAAGFFVVLLSLAASLMTPGGGRQLRLIQPVALGLVQLSFLVARADLGLAAWGLFGALALGCLFLAQRRPAEHRLLPPFALLLALLLIAFTATFGEDPVLPFAAAATTLVFAAYGWWIAGRTERLLGTVMASLAFAAPIILLRLADPELLGRPGWGMLMLGLAAGPLLIAWRQRRHANSDPLPDKPLLAASQSSAILLAIGFYDLLPPRSLSAAWLLLAFGAALAGRKVKDSAISVTAIALSAFALIWALLLVEPLWSTMAGSLAGEPALASSLPSAADALLLLGLPGGLVLFLCPLLPFCYGRSRAATFAAAGIFLTAAAYILFKQAFGLDDAAEFAARGFAERMVITQGLFAAGWLLASGRLPFLASHPASRTAGTALTLLAAARFVWFDLLIHNPVLVTQHVGPLPLINLLLPAFWGTALWLYLARRRGPAKPAWNVLFLVALIAGAACLVRQAFQGAILTGPSLPLPEFYGYSLAGLVLSIALLVAGVRLPDKPLRFAGLLLLTATILKVFLVDASALDGLLRILSFLGLGIALIGIGKLYSTVLSTSSARPKAADPA